MLRLQDLAEDLSNDVTTSDRGRMNCMVEWHGRIQATLLGSMYDKKEAIPTETEYLSPLAKLNQTDKIATELKWDILTSEKFERLIFTLISSEANYENPEWLTRPNAPDRGCDLSVSRVFNDPFSGTLRERVIIQCKHYQSKSVSPTDIATLKEQMKLWKPPRIDVLVIAASGRFTSDAVAAIKKHNQSDSALRIEM